MAIVVRSARRASLTCVPIDGGKGGGGFRSVLDSDPLDDEVAPMDPRVIASCLDQRMLQFWSYFINWLSSTQTSLQILLHSGV